MQGDLNETETFEFRACGPINTYLQDDSNFIENNPLEIDLTNRELNILLLLVIEAYSKDSKAELSFQGIKNKLNLHQQKVTTALKRLQAKKLIEKTSNGYTLTKHGIQIINSLLKSSPTKLISDTNEYIGLEVLIPLDLEDNKLSQLISLLKGRWFADWRWIGMFQSTNSIKMEWQSLSGMLEACLCITKKRMCIAVFDKNSSPTNPNMDLLDLEFNKFLKKIQKLMNLGAISYQTVSKTRIKTHSSCNKRQICDWLSNYA
ncbi:MAG: MarR family transcriptional regulator [Candidatus Helarchaeota archaeon]